MSNLGLSRISRPDDAGAELEKFVFTQGGMATGPPIGCNCVSIDGGPLVISFTWQDGAVSNDLIKNMATAFGK